MVRVAEEPSRRIVEATHTPARRATYVDSRYTSLRSQARPAATLSPHILHADPVPPHDCSAITSLYAFWVDSTLNCATVIPFNVTVEVTEAGVGEGGGGGKP